MIFVHMLNKGTVKKTRAMQNSGGGGLYLLFNSLEYLIFYPIIRYAILSKIFNRNLSISRKIMKLRLKHLSLCCLLIFTDSY
jgi:hypothetical protein